MKKHRSGSFEYFGLALALSTLFLQTGCHFTVATHYDLKRLASPCLELQHEFSYNRIDDRFLRNRGGIIVRGVSLGESEVEGRIYSRYQFAGVLAGPKTRVLEVLFSNTNEYPSQIRERERLEEGTNAVFIFSTYMIDSEELKAPAVYFTRYYPGENVTNYIGRSMNMDVDIDEYRICFIHFLRADPKTGELVWDLSSVDEQLKLRWVVRSRAKYRLNHLNYLYAVPLDILTSPYQIFGYFAVDEPIF